MLKIYTYKNCDTCRRATKWLAGHHVAFVEHPIRETPPTQTELRAMLKALNGEVRRLFNTSGRDYREQKLGERLEKMSVNAALQLLGTNGNLVKRPFVIGAGVAKAGFDEVDWREIL